MNSRFFFGLAVALALLGPTLGKANDEYVFAKLVSSEKLKYPSGARFNSWEGWAYYTYVIGVDGRVNDVLILDSNGVQTLNQALVENIKSRLYKPATLNGRVVEQVNGVSRATFLLTGKPRTADRKFYRRYNKAKSAISNGEHDEAEAIIQELSRITRRSLYEELYLQSLYVAFYTSVDDLDRAYTHTLRVLDFYAEDDDKEKLVEKDYFVPFLVNAYQYEVNSMMLGDALSSASWLKKIAPESDSTKQVAKHANQFSKNIDERQHTMSGTLMVPVYGGENGRSHITLLKSEFELTDVKGDIHRVTLHCDNGMKRLDLLSGVAWIVPSSWGQCGLDVLGNVGTTFKLTEFPSGTLVKHM